MRKRLAAAAIVAALGFSDEAFAQQVRPGPLSVVNFLSEQNVAQIQIGITISNADYFYHGDIQRIELMNGDRRLLFVARSTASLRWVAPGSNGSYPRQENGCRWGGVGLAVCALSNSPAPPSGALFHYPLFELAPENCGIVVCSSITPAQLGAFLQGDVRATYVIDHGGTGVPVSCMLKTSPDEAAYYADAGWFSPGCEVEDRDGDGIRAELDCNDSNLSVYPDAPEYADGYDTDCDGYDN